MAVQKSKTHVKTRIQSVHEREIRIHHNQVRKLKQWCLENNVELKKFYEASPQDICVLSLSDYDLLDCKNNIEVDNDSYFISDENLEVWKNYNDCCLRSRQQHYISEHF